MRLRHDCVRHRIHCDMSTVAVLDGAAGDGVLPFARAGLLVLAQSLIRNVCDTTRVETVEVEMVAQVAGIPAAGSETIGTMDGRCESDDTAAGGPCRARRHLLGQL